LLRLEIVVLEKNVKNYTNVTSNVKHDVPTSQGDAGWPAIAGTQHVAVQCTILKVFQP